jgi:hypothetical protein
MLSPVEFEVTTGGRVLLPLNGGMAWMNMLIAGFAGVDVFAGWAALAVEVGVAATVGLAVAGGAAVAAVIVAIVLEGVGVVGTFLDESGLGFASCWEGSRAALGTALVAADVLILRAPADEASLLAFSRICFCFSSSLARMGTKSSGIGLLSWHRGCQYCWRHGGSRPHQRTLKF